MKPAEIIKQLRAKLYFAKQRNKQLYKENKQLKRELVKSSKDPIVSKLCHRAFVTAFDKGWYDGSESNAVYLALIHSEVSEALEADRIGDYENFQEELADICIRVFSFAGANNIDLEKRILEKMESNELRPYMHGKRY